MRFNQDLEDTREQEERKELKYELIFKIGGLTFLLLLFVLLVLTMNIIRG